ncbi:MAG: winged helix-turn-helix transcriptional regulator [Clostridia bacterium]|nr:winged helix-turn-helix transcriptional regulator [Clostridia bacterium]
MEELYQKFTVLICSIYRNIHKLKDKEMAEFGLKGTHVTCLYFLHVKGEMTAAELSRLSGEDKAAVSRAVDFLANSGYVFQAEGAYRQMLKLTDKGVEIAIRIAKKMHELVAFVGSDINEDERKKLYKALNLFDQNLKALNNIE